MRIGNYQDKYQKPQSFGKSAKVDREYIKPLGENAVKYAKELALKLSDDKVNYIIRRRFITVREPDNIRAMPVDDLQVEAQRSRRGIAEFFKVIPIVFSLPINIGEEIKPDFIESLRTKALEQKSYGVQKSILNFFKKLIINW